MSTASSRSKSFAFRESGGTRSVSTDGGAPQYFSLRWNNHPVNLVSGFSGLFNNEKLVDVTLAADGRHLLAHKMLLSACSDYFQSLFSLNPCQHPIVILKDVTFEDLLTVVQFMYNGVVSVSSDRLSAVLKTADTLQIKGLGEKYSESVNSLIGQASSRNSSMERGHSVGGSSAVVGRSFGSSRLLSVPSQHSFGPRQLSTESLPEYLHRSRDLSPRHPSDESVRQHSLESAGIGIGTGSTGVVGSNYVSSNQHGLKRNRPSPPTSPESYAKHYRKKFRHRSGVEESSSSGDRGTSLEDEKPGAPVTGRVSPPAIHLSPSRQSSSSTEHDGTTAGAVGMVVAKKKRELFSARSSRSGGSNQSSTGEYSQEPSFSGKQRLESSGSSGQSQEDALLSGATSTSAVASLMVPSTVSCPRSLNRAQSSGSEASAISRTSSKKSRFLLRRQDCLEKGETDVVKSSPSSPMMVMPPFHVESYASPPPSDQLQLASTGVQTHATSLVTKPRSTAMISSEISKPPRYSPSHSPAAMHFHSGGGGGLASPSIYSSAIGALKPDPSSPLPLSSHKLPMLRVTTDESATTPTLPSNTSGRSAAGIAGSGIGGDMLLLGSNASHRTPPEFRSHMQSHQPSLPRVSRMQSESASSAAAGYSSSPSSFVHAHTSTIGSLIPNVPEQFGHCPKARDGPALGCNYCWNTTDVNGRILRRKTKYHCPDCQANLCIVPCFQAYHEAIEKEKSVPASVESH